MDEDKVQSMNPFKARKFIILDRVPRLRYRCGEIYMPAVLKCLSVDCSDDPNMLREQRDLCAQVVANLSRCWA